MGGSRLHVLERLGGPHERVRDARADAFALNDIAPLNTVAVEVDAGGDAAVIPLAPGLPDDWFEHDGQLTKRDIRAVTLSALAPRKGELLWDVGAGAGSVAIEWMLSDPANRAIAIERDAARAARIARNALSLGVPDLRVVAGEAPQALAELDAPQAIFIGGGADAATLAAAWDALPRFGRIVVNAVTIETQSLLADAYRDNGGELIHLQIAHARPDRPLPCARSGNGGHAMASDKEMNATYAFGLGARRGVAANDIVELVRRVAQTHNVDLQRGEALRARKQGAGEPGCTRRRANLGLNSSFCRSPRCAPARRRRRRIRRACRRCLESAASPKPRRLSAPDQTAALSRRA